MTRTLTLTIGLIACVLLMPTSLWAQKIVWSRAFGGVEGDAALCVQPTLDGGYILAGDTNSYGAGGTDGWLIKTDAEGMKEWDRTFGGPDSDYVNSVQLTLDGGYILAGYTNSYGAGRTDGWLIKTDAEGMKEWDRTFGGADLDRIHSVHLTLDGGYILAGYTRSYRVAQEDAWLIKTDRNGAKKWDRIFGGPDSDRVLSAQLTWDGGYILAGDTYSYGAEKGDVWLIKTDAEGEKEWDRTFGGPDHDMANSVQPTLDGGYILAGYTNAYMGRTEAWLIKTDAEGEKEWDRTFFGGPDHDMANSVQPTLDGGYILAGHTNAYTTGRANGWLIKTDAKGKKKWSRISHYRGNTNSVQLTLDGGYILAGDRDVYDSGKGDVWLIKMADVGEIYVTIRVRRSTVGSKITAGRIGIRAGDPADFAATVMDAAGDPNPLDEPATWEVEGKAGIVDESGYFIASTRAGDTGQLIATAGGFSDTLWVTVIPNLLKHIEITPASVKLSPGERVTFRAQGYDRYENRLNVRALWYVTSNIGTIGSTTGTLVVGDTPGTGDVVAFAQAVFADALTDVSGSARVVVRTVAKGYALYPNVPNPFNSFTVIPYVLPRASVVHIGVYNSQGNLVQMLAEGLQEAGHYRVLWDGRDRQAKEVSSGIYFVRLEASERAKQVTRSQTRRITLLR